MSGCLRPTILLAVLLGCVLSSPPAKTAGEQESARPAAVTVDENAPSLEGRQEALKKLQDAAQKLLDAGESVEAARTLNRAGLMEVKLNSPKTAVDTYEKARALLKSSPSLEVEIDSLNGLAAAHLVLKNMDQVADLLDRSLVLCAQTAYPRGQAQALLTLSELQNYSNHAVAFDTGQKALAIWQSLDDKPNIARSYSMVGQCLLAQNRLTESIQKYETALKIWRDLGNQSEQAAVLIMLGIIDQRKAEWQSSIAYFTEAQRLVDERAEPRKMGQISASLGIAFEENGLPEVGLGHYQRALAYFQLTQNPRSVRSAMTEIGRIYYLLHDYPRALDYFQEVLKDVDPEGLDATTSYEFFGRIYGAMGEYERALQYFEKAHSILVRSVNPMEAAQMLALMGQIYEQQGQLDRARNLYQQALTQFENVTDRLDEAAVLYGLGKLELKVGKLDLAEDYLRKSIAVTENMRQVPTSTDLTAAFSGTVHERYESYIECLMRKHQQQPGMGFDERAFETNESGRARSLVELLRATGADLATGVDPELAKQEQALRHQIRVKEDERITLLSGAYKKEDLEAIESELASLETQDKQVDDSIRKRYPAYGQVVRPVALNLREIQNRVIRDDQTALLEFSLGTNASYVWVVTQKDVSSFQLPPRSQIEAAAKRYYDAVTVTQPRPGETPEQRLARIQKAEGQLSVETATLSDLLLTPIAEKLDKKRLLIVADGALQYVPFQSLNSPQRGSASITAGAAAPHREQRPLLMDYEVVNEPSALALALVMTESVTRRPASKSVAVIADPVFNSDDSRIQSTGSPSTQSLATGMPEAAFAGVLRDMGIDVDRIPRLISSREEADAIMKAVPWRTGFKAVDFDANRTTAMKTDLGQYRIVHFATHALLDDQRPEFSGIVLSLVDSSGRRQNGYLRLHEIYNLKLPVDLVVLSACQTGLGKDVKGEGLIGLTRGFMYAGASGVVASLWKVDDEATAELMKHFYEGLFDKGLSPAAALREAQLALRKQKRWQEPYYWAGFVIQGQYDHPLALGHRSRAWQIAGLVTLGAALLATTLLFLRRRRS